MNKLPTNRWQHMIIFKIHWTLFAKIIQSHLKMSLFYAYDTIFFVKNHFYKRNVWLNCEVFFRE